MEIFVSKIKHPVDLGNGNTVFLKKLSYDEILSSSEGMVGKSDGRVAYEAICKHIDSWSGPDLDEKPLTEETFSLLSPDFFDVVGPHVMALRGLTEEEGND